MAQEWMFCYFCRKKGMQISLIIPYKKRVAIYIVALAWALFSGILLAAGFAPYFTHGSVAESFWGISNEMSVLFEIIMVVNNLFIVLGLLFILFFKPSSVEHILLENLPAGIVLTGKNDRIAFINNEFKRIGGLAHIKMKSKEAREFFATLGIETSDLFIDGLEKEFTLPHPANPVHLLIKTIALKNTYGKHTGWMIHATDVSEKRKEAVIIRRNAELRQLNRYLNNIREEERISISREIHDNLGQNMTAFRIKLFKLLKSGIIKGDESESLLKFFDTIIQDTKTIAHKLRIKTIEDFGLTVSLEELISEFAKNFGIACELRIPLNVGTMPLSDSIAIYRIIQESLTNAARHSRASKIIVSVKQLPHKLIVRIFDNGKGFDKNYQHPKRTLGVLGMKERAQMIAGKLTILNRHDGHWVLVRLEIEQE